MKLLICILIEIAAAAGGILIGLKVDNYTDARKEKDESLKTLGYIKGFVAEIYKIVTNDDSLSNVQKMVYVLSEYKCHWDALLTGEHLAFRTINDEVLDEYSKGELYFELNYIFSFWEQNKNHWVAGTPKTYDTFTSDGCATAVFLAQVTLWKTRLEKMHQALIKTLW